MKKTYIIAEAGVNHNMDYDIAIKLIDNAKLCGADAIKFQATIPEELMTIQAKQSQYQIKNFKSSSQLEMAKKLFFDNDVFIDLKKYCDYKNIEFMCSPFDQISMSFLLKTIKPKKMKIASGEILNTPMLDLLKNYKGDIIISSGMSTLTDIRYCLNILKRNGSDKDKITILHCHTDYPTKLTDVNLSAMLDIKNKFKTKIGYSDHTLGIEIPVAAVALGADIIEKHITIDKMLPGPDQSSSLDIIEFKEMVKLIRNIELSIGDGIKKPRKNELKNSQDVKKSIVAKKEIRIGETFSVDNITTKRPDRGISSRDWDRIIGKKSKYFFNKDDFIKL